MTAGRIELERRRVFTANLGRRLVFSFAQQNFNVFKLRHTFALPCNRTFNLIEVTLQFFELQKRFVLFAG